MRALVCDPLATKKGSWNVGCHLSGGKGARCGNTFEPLVKQLCVGDFPGEQEDYLHGLCVCVLNSGLKYLALLDSLFEALEVSPRDARVLLEDLSAHMVTLP